jgi:cardiolipin synthase
MTTEARANNNFLGRPELEQKLESTDYELLPSRSFIDKLLEDMSHARRSIDLQFHAYEGDNVGMEIADALHQARRRGLWVRFIVDHFSDLKHSDQLVGFPFLNRALNQDRLIAEVRNTQRVFNELGQEGVFVKRVNPLGVLNRRFLSRDHKKIVVIDGQEVDGVAYIGGINITDHNVSWRDFMVRMTGDVVQKIQYDYEMTAMGINGQGHEEKFNDGFLVTDEIGDSRILPRAIELIDKASRQVLIESPYLWGGRVKSALKAAVKRGINVVFIAPNKLGRYFVPTARDLRDLSLGGVDVFQYGGEEPMFHSRMLVADETVVVGSNPFNEFTNGKVAEIGIFSADPNLRASAVSMILGDMYNSTRFTA